MPQINSAQSKLSIRNMITYINFRMAALLGVLLLATMLLVYNLPNWPTTWYDEGVHVQVPKNLLQYGKYGINSSEGFRMFDPLVNVGPTVLVPIAFVFNILGVGLYQARIVMVIYALLSILFLFLITEHLFDTKTATLASFLLIIIPATSNDISGSFLGLGRMVLGEVPTLCFVLAGSFLWFKALDKGGIIPLVGAGLLFGLAILTKQHALLLPITLLFIWMVDRLWYGQLRWFQIILPIAVSLACIFLWYAFQLYAPGSSFSEQSAGVGRISTVATVGLTSPRQMITGVRTLLASGSLIWGIPGLIYGFYLSHERSLAGLKQSFLLGIIIIWLAWFVLGSIGWLRYAFVALAIMNIFTPKLLVDLTNGFSFSWQSLSSKDSTHKTKAVLNLAVTAAIILMIFIPLQQRAKDIFSAYDTTPFELARYLDEHVSQETIIESFEPEIAFLSNHTFHQPSLKVLMQAIRYVQFGEPYPPNFYNLNQTNLSYLVNGSFGKWTGLYTNELESGEYILVRTIGI